MAKPIGTLNAKSENKIGKAKTPRIYLSMINFSIELIHDKMCINNKEIIVQMKMLLAKRVSKLEIVITWFLLDN
tara:strand:- start:44 stop:265 length:222 start_codon:yes stop_codon:yes gene_type:complete